MNNNWKKFYRTHKFKQPSSFAKFILPWIKFQVLELGCGDGRDTKYFAQHNILAEGVDSVYSFTVEDRIKEICPDYVYARFFWHAIDRKLQLAILKWTKKYLFIEARTTEDKKTKKVFENHKRNYVDVPQLVKDLKTYGFEIEYLKEGRGLSKYKKEDPYLVRVIAIKK